MPKYEHLAREWRNKVSAVRACHARYKQLAQAALADAQYLLDNPDELDNKELVDDMWLAYRQADLAARRWLNEFQSLMLNVEEEYIDVPWPKAREQGLAGFLRASGLIPGAYTE